MSKVQNRLAEIGAKMDTAGGSTARRSRSVISDRVTGIEAISQGSKVHVTLHRLDPGRIRMWAGHNRDYAALNAENCSDVIDSFRRHEQVVPALGRRLSGDPGHDVELIFGARRHFAASYLHRELLVQIRDVDDREAFILQDLENRDRQDVTHLEQARDYLRALPLYFADSIKVMADQLQIDRTQLNRLIGLAKLPPEIIEAYAERRELVVHHGTVYRKLMEDGAAKRRVLAAARKLGEGGGVDGKKVLATLTQAAKASAVAAEKPSVGTASVASMTRKQLTMRLQLPSARTPEAVARVEADMIALVRELLLDAGK